MSMVSSSMLFVFHRRASKNVVICFVLWGHNYFGAIVARKYVLYQCYCNNGHGKTPADRSMYLKAPNMWSMRFPKSVAL